MKDIKTVYINVSLALFIVLSCSNKKSGKEIQERLVTLVTKEKIQKTLEHKAKIQLSIGDGPVLGWVSRLAVSDNAFFLIDNVGQTVSEYTRSGNYSRTIGRRGKGPGEYLTPIEVATDLSGNIYVYDGASGRLNVYNSDGEFIENLHREKVHYTDKLLFDRKGNLLQLTGTLDNGNAISNLRKFSRTERKQFYTVKLSDPETSSLTSFFGAFIGFCYSPSLNRIYYSLPWDYKIKEIDAGTGNVLGLFGVKSRYYRPLDLSLEKNKLREEALKGTILQDMFLFDEKYIFARYSHSVEPGRKPQVFCLVYNITSENNIKASIIDDVPFLGLKKADMHNDLLYVYSSPKEKHLDVSNGSIDIFSLVSNSN